MLNKLDFLKNQRNISGIEIMVSKKNIDYHEYGFSISEAKIISKDDVFRNRKILAENLNTDISKIKFQNQIHSDIIRIINSNSKTEDSDAMICTEKGLHLVVNIADCAAVLIYDMKNKVIAGIHSGWKGTSLNIVSKSINKMKKEFNCDPKDIYAFVSPCASGDKYEIEWDVAKHFPNSIKKISETKYLFDNKKEINSQLLESGVIQENIEISDICTISDENYHSFRRDKEKSGRMAAIIAMI